MQGAVLRQDAAAARCPWPVSAYAAEKKNKKIDRKTDVEGKKINGSRHGESGTI